MKFQVLTIFPERYRSYTESGLPCRAVQKGLFEIVTVNMREFADPNRGWRIDDEPYGGGPGMILQVAPIDRALQSLKDKFPVIMFTPRGKKLNQKMIRRFSTMNGLTLLNGYYEGIDERVAEHLVDHQISIGDYILNSGDLASLCLIEAVTRLLPGYMGSPESLSVESNDDHLLEYPHYSRPSEYRGWSVPEALLSGDHARVQKWRTEKSLEITEQRRLDHE